MNKDEIRLMSLELIGDYGKEGAIDACKLAMEEINLEEELETPISIVSVGPDRSQTIQRNKVMA